MIDNKNGSCGTYEPVGIVSVSDTVEIIGSSNIREPLIKGPSNAICNRNWG